MSESAVHSITMITGAIRNKIDPLWDAFWSGGISNPLDVIEQIIYGLFLKRLDDLHTLEENETTRLKLKKLEHRLFPEGKELDALFASLQHCAFRGGL